MDASINTRIKSCHQEGCAIKLDGKCLEGLENNDCPHFYWEDNDSEEIIIVTEDSQENNKPTIGKKLFTGSELRLHEVPLVTNKFSCEFVLLLGDKDSGKTTLLSTIFDLFQTGYFKTYIFAGSLTQKGFEIRSHLSRVSSGLTKPVTERTKALEFRVLHLAIKEAEQKIKHFLISDISGETIKLARSSSSAMKEHIEELKHANHIFYIIDGEKLNIQNRTKTLNDAKIFIKSAIDNSIFTQNTVLKILISKWDLVEQDFNLENVVISTLNERFAKHLNEIQYLTVASRPSEPSNLDLGFGVDLLIDNLMKNNESVKNESADSMLSNRLFKNFKVKEDD